MGNRYLVVSDLHLADVEDHDDGWMAHKGSAYTFDGQLTQLVQDFVEQGDGDRLTLLLNGDILDFDLVTAVPDDPPWPVRWQERRSGLDPTAEKSAWKLGRILDHHPGFVELLARFMGQGHQVVYLMGNHDRELHFSAVQHALLERIEACARELKLSLAAGSIRFEPWFFYVAGEIYAEHAHQYDFYTSFRHQLHPTIEVRGEQQLALPMGNLTNRLLMSRMGFFNPHATDYILNLFRYMAHWARHYLFSRRSLMFNWFWGSLLVLVTSLRTRRALQEAPPQHHERLRQLGRHYDLAPEELAALGSLHPPPITSRMFRLLRELWLDRLVLGLLLTGATVALALVPIPLWIKLMVPLCGFPLLYLLYELLAEGETVFSLTHEIPDRARSVAQTLPARVVTFGHTHTPRIIPLDPKTSFVDTGTWAPALEMAEGGKRKLRPGLRNYLLVAFERGQLQLRLGCAEELRSRPQ